MFAASSFYKPIGNWGVTSVKHMNYIFSGNEDFNKPRNDWNVQKVRSFHAMFLNNSFNQDNWKVDNAIDMAYMFRAESFNGPYNLEPSQRQKNEWNVFREIGDWNVQNVRNTQEMFAGATSFNHGIGDWIVQNMQSMNGMSAGTTSFNQDIGDWNVQNV